MAYIPLGGKSRRYLNTDTGEEISRRQYFKLMRGTSFEEIARRNKEQNLAASLARPARGRPKAATQEEIERRLEAARIQQENARINRINRAAKKEAKKVRVKKIRPQLLKTGHRAARIPFNTYGEYEDLIQQMRTQKLSNGRRLITSYALGLTGFDERTGRELDATLWTLQSPSVKVSEDELEDTTEDFLMEKMYFIFSHYWLHLHFDINYAEARAKKAREKNIPREYRKRK